MNAALLIDVDNLYRSVGKVFQTKLDYERYLQYLEEKFQCAIGIKFAFGSQNPLDAKKFIQVLKGMGFTIRFEEDIDWNVSMALTATRIASSVQVVIIGSNHPNLVPLVKELQDRGLRTFICACNIHPALRNVSEFHEIDQDLVIVQETEVEALATAE